MRIATGTSPPSILGRSSRAIKVRHEKQPDGTIKSKIELPNGIEQVK
ncbi:MAG: hypothetical protein IZT59_10790 [Verrucomicrobia bacterium]|nr:hypothetical protein [Verrucomicrobiota bacterium]